ncbi:hypothetical protein B0H19DRAFT_1082312 [Mycena capillaripes]|nr:hypothetical protein B0H19DRAFT_1082312 [Mycena capillaripes]
MNRKIPIGPPYLYHGNDHQGKCADPTEERILSLVAEFGGITEDGKVSGGLPPGASTRVGQIICHYLCHMEDGQMAVTTLKDWQKTRWALASVQQFGVKATLAGWRKLHALGVVINTVNVVLSVLKEKLNNSLLHLSLDVISNDAAGMHGDVTIYND